MKMDKLKKICTCCKEKGTINIKLEFHLCNKHTIEDFYRKELEYINQAKRRFRKIGKKKSGK